MKWEEVSPRGQQLMGTSRRVGILSTACDGWDMLWVNLGTLCCLPSLGGAVCRGISTVCDTATAWTQWTATCVCVRGFLGPQQTRPCAWVRVPTCSCLNGQAIGGHGSTPPLGWGWCFRASWFIDSQFGSWPLTPGVNNLLTSRHLSFLISVKMGVVNSTRISFPSMWAGQVLEKGAGSSQALSPKLPVALGRLARGWGLCSGRCVSVTGSRVEMGPARTLSAPATASAFPALWPHTAEIRG